MSPQPGCSDAPWWVDAFGADYLDLYAHRDDCAATAEVAGLLPRLRTAPGPVLDAACGNGRHLAALRAAGLTAAGFDYSPALLAVARSRPQAVGRLARGDLRRPPFAGGWGAVLLLFTAFGYFDDTANAACLAALARLLAPGGWLLLDLPDPAQVRATLVAESSRTTPAGHRVRERRRLEGTWVVKDVAYGCGGQERRWQERVRLYEPDEIAALVAAAGLTLAERWPSLRGPVHDDHRHVVWCQAAPGPPWTDALASAAAG